MGKGIIVVDKPETCLDCGYCIEIEEGITACCGLVYESKIEELLKEFDNYCHEVPGWCPIKEIPPKMEELKRPHSLGDFERKGFARGWNDAIEKIERLGD